MKKAPATYNGKALVYQETFKSPFEKSTKADAMRTLEAIRECHPASSGWLEIEGYAEQLPNGNWRAVRNHAQYR